MFFKLLPVDLALVFFGASILLALSPGPDNLFVLGQSITQGRRAGVVTTLGLCSGLLVHSTGVVFGVSVLIANSTFGFTILRCVGAAYLLYLALNIWRQTRAERVTPGPVSSLSQLSQMQSSGSLYLTGVVMNLTNPKVVIFFLAFLPGFIDSKRGDVMLQGMLLGALFMLAAMMVFMLIVHLSAALVGRLQNESKILGYLNQFTAVVFVGLAINLLLGVS